MDIGVECTPKPTRTEDLQKLCTLDLPEDQSEDWIVYTYVCNEEVSKEDDLYGLLICLGHYPNKALARKYAREIALKTDTNICILQLGRWGELHSKPQVENSEIICVDVKGNIVKLEDQRFEREKELYEKKRKKERLRAQGVGRCRAQE